MTNSDQTRHHFAARDISEGVIACVDVVIAARDRADTIERAVSSALAQVEVRTVIVVDDGSTDDTTARAIRCDAESKRVIIQRLKSSVGPSAARNIAIDISTAPWLAILDADDFFLPGRIGMLLSQTDNWDLVADNLLQVSEYRIGHEPTTLIPFGTFVQPKRLTLEQFVLGNVTRRGFHRKEFGYLKPLIRRSFLDLHALRYDETLRLGEDYALYARALAAGARFLLVPMLGYVSVVRADSLSARHSRQDLEALKASDYALMATDRLTPSEREAIANHHSDLDYRAHWLVLIEAFKSHNYPLFIAELFRSRTMAFYLLGRLFEEVPLQIRKRFMYLCGR